MSRGWPTHVISINQDHIDHAISRKEAQCMIADAIMAKYPHVRHVRVDLATIRWSDLKKKLRYIFFTPRHAQQPIIDFDRGHRDRLKPFNVTLRAPAQVHPVHDSIKPKGAPRKPRKRPSVERKGKNVILVGGRPLPNGNMQKKRNFGACDLIP